MERSTTQCSTTTDRRANRGRTRGYLAGHECGTKPKRCRWRAGSAFLLSLLALPAALAGVVRIERISPPPLDLEVPLPSASPVLSADGRFVAFVSGDLNERPEIFVRDRETGKTELVSVGAGGAPANGYVGSPVISSDGRFVAFVSYATNLVSGDTNGRADVFVAERE